MRLKSVFVAGLLSVSVSVSAEKITLKKPPASLGKYYPPASKNFEFLYKMYDMSTAFYGIRLNINDGSWDKALRWARQLRDDYIKTKKMVPEWKSYFKPELADKLVNAVESKSVEKVIEASKELGKTCAKCHADNEIVVKLVYHYPSFENIKIEDPVEFAEYTTGKYMKAMTNSMKALKIYLQQEDTEKAQEAGINFVERARQLRSMCSKCHTNKLSEELIVGKDFEKALSNMEELLSGDKVNAKEVFKALGSVSISCAKCHNVHLVPAMVQEAFRR